MRKYRLIIAGLSVLLAAAFLAGCAGMAAKPTEDNFKAPTVTLNRVEIPYYWGYWYYSNKVEPTKGTAGNYGAPMGLAFIFEIENPNDYPVLMESLKFSIAFEEFVLNTVGADEPMWIPAGKTNQLRVNAIMDARTAVLSLLVTGGFQLKENFSLGRPGKMVDRCAGDVVSDPCAAGLCHLQSRRHGQRSGSHGNLSVIEVP